MNKKINVLSLFDGMSCCQLALTRAGIEYDNYFASEIDKYAIKVTMENYPSTIQLGDITKIHGDNLPTIDLLVGGSPCQGFSFAGKGLNFKDDRSKLFFEYVRILNEIKQINPDVIFLLENVYMKFEHELVISKYLGIEPIKINSALLSAQNRRRNYWTNINSKPVGLFGDLKPDIPQPKDKGIMLKDILQQAVDDKYYLSEKAIIGFQNHQQKNSEQGNGFGWNLKKENDKASCLPTGSEKSTSTYLITNQKIRTSNYNQDVITDAQEEKFPTLRSNAGGITRGVGIAIGCDYRTDEGIRIRDNGKSGTLSARARTDESCGQLVIIQDQINEPLIATKENVYPSGGTAGIIHDIDNKSVTVTGQRVNSQGFIKIPLTPIEQQNKIRRLTPIECARLQTVPDEYFYDKDGRNIISDSQIYRCLGNGFTVDVIAYILSFMNRE